MRGLPIVVAVVLLLAGSGGAVPTPEHGTGPGLPAGAAAVLAEGGTVSLTWQGEVLDLSAEPRDLLADGVRPRLAPQDTERPRPDADTYVGDLAGHPDAEVRLILDGSVEGYVLLADDTMLWLLPRADGGADLVPVAELARRGPHRSLAGDAMRSAVDEAVETQDSPGHVLELRLALEGDHLFYQLHTDDWDEKMLRAFHLVEGIYRSQVNVRFNVTWIGAWDEPDPYTSTHLCGSDGKLRQFRDHWEANRDDVPRHNAYLTAGGSNGDGCGYIRDVATSWAYAVSYWLWTPFFLVPQGFTYHRTILIAHELGHNFGALHGHSTGPYGLLGPTAWPVNCVGTIMVPCYPGAAAAFGPDNLLSMRSYAESRLPARAPA